MKKQPTKSKKTKKPSTKSKKKTLKSFRVLMGGFSSWSDTYSIKVRAVDIHEARQIAERREGREALQAQEIGRR